MKYYVPVESVSILAPAQGASRTHNFPISTHGRFNSRPRTGGIAAHYPERHGEGVSILAPAQGASSGVIGAVARYLFQFSPPHRGHRAISTYGKSVRSFNSRPRTGGIQNDTTEKWLEQFQFSPPHRGHPHRANDGD